MSLMAVTAVPEAILPPHLEAGLEHCCHAVDPGPGRPAGLLAGATELQEELEEQEGILVEVQ